jgi:hypothetical protein
VADASPLAELNAYIRRVSLERAGADAFGAPVDPGELASARRFRHAWNSGRTLDQLQQAIARTPANAGPLNSHALAVRSLELMGELSTDYLRRFLVSVETLQWLEAARQQYPRQSAAAKSATRSRKRK